LFIADLRLEIPRGWWPVANLNSRDGLPVTFVAEDGTLVGRLEAVAKGHTPRAEDGWAAMDNPSSQHAAAILDAIRRGHAVDREGWAWLRDLARGRRSRAPRSLAVDARTGRVHQGGPAPLTGPGRFD
jgi:hypothetical protein